jgi:hypothetical protein
MSSKRKIKRIIRKLQQRNSIKGLKQVKYYYKLGKYIHQHGSAPEKIDRKFRKGALRVYLYFRNQPLALEPAYKKLQRMKEEEFVQLLEDKDSSTRGILSGTSCDFMDQQTLTASEEVSDLQNSNTFDLFWEDLLADPNQPQLTPINLDQPQLTPINPDQPRPTPINPN